MSKLHKIKNREKILKKPEGKCIYSENKNKNYIELLRNHARKKTVDWNIVLKEKIKHLKLYQAELSFKAEGK